ncbi:energy-coupling factor transporter transmembrane protein EcfT [Arthrobacter sp. SDTb3-6]|uniref:energy-coupling factor transporter transmembrane component T family protein n=1 Tax=Arthrobacter sp. SDTb3-6 TaxID=2713571 RepID=UPI00159E668C|nr:energy-coupling factor transporter transmembrane protein EcfT [Arthrobacter sp. SDTb3-6]NVN00658.1 energy-coupling factor transporter transmembrane protein EcfT [Arthrobacter sp. SDTb3-6]
MMALYAPGVSLVHRTPAGLKLPALAAGVLALSSMTGLAQLGTAILATILLYALARIPWALAGRQLRPFLWVLGAVLLFQILLSGWQHAALATGTLVTTIALANLLTLTTTVSAILDTCQRALRPLRRFGVDPERVGLLLALAIRCLPLVADIVRDVSDAQKARAAHHSVLALAAPAVVRALRTADALGESLMARGFDD